MHNQSIKNIQVFGNSLGVIIPIEFLRALKLDRGDEVVIFLAPDNTVRVAKVPEDHLKEVIKF